VPCSRCSPSRLSRIIDRARTLEAQLAAGSPSAATNAHAQLAALARRAQLISRAITLCTITAFARLRRDRDAVPGSLRELRYLGARGPVFRYRHVTFFAGLLFFLREIFVATANLRIGPH